MPDSAPWPSPGEYSTAIQNPQNCFSDPGLKIGTVRRNHLGLPIGLSGNFAVVYELQSKTQVFAVRCFIRPVTDQQERYLALSRHLTGFSLPTLVDFRYLPQGIRVRGKMYPVVQMEWVPGKQLHRYVEEHLHNSQALDRLAANWRGVIAGLTGARMAHGDLQHGNILVDVHGQIRLVDYDEMFIPALQGKPPGEAGHSNYQHPERVQKAYYGENTDAFSTLVIYLSVRALRVNPQLWRPRFHNGDNLLLSAADFKGPGKTPIWAELRASSDGDVRRLTAELLSFCQKPVEKLPHLEAVIQGLPGPTPRATPSPLSPALEECPKCRASNAAGEIFCQRCLHQLCGNELCPGCRRSIPTRAHFCPFCRKAL